MTRSKHEAYFAQLWEQQAAKRERFNAGLLASTGKAPGCKPASVAARPGSNPGESTNQRGMADAGRVGQFAPSAYGRPGGELSDAANPTPTTSGLGLPANPRCPASVSAITYRCPGYSRPENATAGSPRIGRTVTGPLTLNAAAKDARPSTSRGGVVPVPTFLAVAPIQRAKADAGRVGQLGNEPCGRPGGERPGAASSAPLYALVHACRQAGLSEPVPEYQFHPLRRWRFDYAWPLRLIAVEIEGGIWTQGRHTRGAGALADMEKYNAAALLGWRLLRYSPQTLGQAIPDLRVMLARTA